MTLPVSVKVLQEPGTVAVPKMTAPVAAPAIIKVTVPGLQGPPGPQGAPGQPRWSGDGPPGVIIGAEPGDEYLDDLTGDVYRLI